MRCPWCGVTNRPDMAFCCECGESLDGSVPAPTLSVAPPDAGPRERVAAWELRLGVTLVLFVAVAASVAGWQDSQRATQARFYSHAQAALTQGHKVQALADFQAAGNYADAPALAARLAPQVAALKVHYAEGLEAAGQGAWWDAAWALGQAADIQVSYQDVITRLREARIQSGPLFYRHPAPNGANALWSAQADGRDAHRLLWTDGASALLALDAGGRWAVVSGVAGAAAQQAGPFLVDLTTGGITSLAQKYRNLDSTTAWARFRSDSQGFWWGDSAQAYYYDLGAGRGLPLSEQPAAIDPLHARLLLNRLLLPTLADLSSHMLLSDPVGSVRTLLAVEPQEVAAPSFSDDGRYLLYTLLDRTVLDAAGRRVTTATLVLNDLLHPAAPVRTVLLVHAVVGAQPGDVFRAAFLPGSHAVFAVATDGAHWTLRAWTGGTAPVVLARDSAADAGPLAQVLPLPDGAGVALSLGAPGVAPADLLLVDLAGHQSPVASRLPGGRWVAASDDGGQALIVRADPKAPAVGRLLAHLNLRQRPAGEVGADAGAWFPVTLPPAGAGSEPVFSHDGRRVLLTGAVAGVPGFYTIRPDGSDPLLIVPGSTAFWTR